MREHSWHTHAHASSKVNSVPAQSHPVWRVLCYSSNDIIVRMQAPPTRTPSSQTRSCQVGPLCELVPALHAEYCRFRLHGRGAITFAQHAILLASADGNEPGYPGIYLDIHAVAARCSICSARMQCTNSHPRSRLTTRELENELTCIVARCAGGIFDPAGFAKGDMGNLKLKEIKVG